MFARLVKVKIKEGQLEALRDIYHDLLMKRSGSYSKGNKGSQLLINQETHEVIAYSLWESREAMDAGAYSDWNEKLKAAVNPFLEGSRDVQVYEVGTSVNF